MLSRAEELAERVQKGADWLDSNWTGVSSWRDRLAVDVLDISDGDWCVIGQLFDYEGDEAQYFMRNIDAEDYGFTARYNEEAGLTAAWVRYLSKPVQPPAPVLTVDDVRAAMREGRLEEFLDEKDPAKQPREVTVTLTLTHEEFSGLKSLYAVDLNEPAPGYINRFANAVVAAWEK